MLTVALERPVSVDAAMPRNDAVDPNDARSARHTGRSERQVLAPKGRSRSVERDCPVAQVEVLDTDLIGSRRPMAPSAETR
jgi:hypothetical protein